MIPNHRAWEQTMKLDDATIRTMSDNDVSFFSEFQTPLGTKTIFLEVDDLQRIVADRIQFVADHLGVTKSQYLDWIEAEGMPRCGATTRNGTPCQNFISGGGPLPAQRWLKLDGRRCYNHGGPDAGQAGRRFVTHSSA
jgi:hypothetical protein